MLRSNPEGEPRITLYVPWWEETWERARVVRPAETRHLFTRLLQRMEEAWEYIRPLELWYEEHAENAEAEGGDYWEAMEFINADIVDIFREVAVDVSRLVPGCEGWPKTASPDDVNGEADAFNRWLIVFGLAAESPCIPDGLRELAHAATAGLTGWSAEVAALAQAIQTDVLSPLWGDNTELLIVP